MPDVEAENNNLKKLTFTADRSAGIEFGECAFDGCGLLQDVVLNGARITALGVGTFKNNRSVTSESVNAIIMSYAENSSSKSENGDVDIPARLFEGCNGVSPATGANFTKLIIPVNVKSIGGCAFGSWENIDYLQEIVVSRAEAPVCLLDADNDNHTVFNGVNPNHVTITFEGNADQYNNSDNTTGYKSYMNDESEFQRLLTKTLNEDEVTYDVFPQMHAIVKLKRTFIEGWNTLALPFGSPVSENKDTDCAKIYTNALNPGGESDFMIAVYRGLKNGTIFTFLKVADDNTTPLDEFEPILVKMSKGGIASDNIYTFANVDLNYDAGKGKLYAPNDLPGCVDSENGRFYGRHDTDMLFFKGNDYEEFYFDGTFCKRSGKGFISSGDYIIQNNKFIECDDNHTYGLKGFRGWFGKTKDWAVR